MLGTLATAPVIWSSSSTGAPPVEMLLLTPLISSPIFTSRSSVTAIATREESHPMKRRLSLIATAQVVPPPQKKSATTSPSLEEALMMRSKRASGFWVG
jgi:uncharacterized membrane protein